MAGSNGSPAQRGGQPPHWPAESDEQARALELERWRQQQAQYAPHGYAQPHAPQQGYPQHAPSYSQPAPSYDPAQYGHPGQQGGYAQPPAPDAGPPVRNPFEPPFGEPPQHQQAQYPQHGQYAPQYERYAPAPAADDYPPQHDPHRYAQNAPAHMPDPFASHHAPAPYEPAPAYDAHQGNQGYAAPRAYSHEPAPAQHDPQSWDLSSYHPGQIPQGYQAQPAQHDHHAQPEWGTPAPAPHEQQWPQLQENAGHWHGDGSLPGPQHFDPAATAQHPHYELDPGYDHNDPHLTGELAGDEYDAPEEPRRGPSTVLVIGMLVGAIVVGGGLAFAYRHFGGGASSVKVAEIKRQTAPEKVRPQDPGGKTIEHSSNVFLNRSGSDGSPIDSRQSDVDGSTKKVATIPIVVNRDGSLTPQSSSESVPSPAGSGVPGLVLDGLGPPPGAPRLRPGMGPSGAEATSSRLPPPPPSVERAPPRIADLPLPRVMNSSPPVTAAVERPMPPPVRKPPQAERPAHRTAVAAVERDTPPRRPAPSASRSGYVAVLASKRSRQEALNAFADLHSQYPDILGSVTPDVREANLGDKGVWYRLIGGPPGSREAARNVCVKLKARGMKDCWPVAY